LVIANWGFIVLEHGLGVVDEVGEILLSRADEQSDRET
jgi:hypothetical protein